MVEKHASGRSDRRSFWEDKILTWERGRYGSKAEARSVTEKAADRASNSLRFRLAFAGDFLSLRVAGKRVVELGCGSGLLAERLIRAGAESYLGFDIAGNAVERAQTRVRDAGLVNKARFEQSELKAIKSLEADIVFSLGLLDWLTDGELDHLFEITGDADFFHSIAERRASLFQWLHRLYVHFAYGYRTGGYVPRYFEIAEIERICAGHNPRPLHVFRSRSLSFGALVSTYSFNDTPRP